MQDQRIAIEERLVSLDVFRGLTMLLLVGESTLIYDHFLDSTASGSFFHALVLQFHHHPWNGLRFWDLIQPFFMFIVGVAMPFSFGARWAKGQSWPDSLKHALKRSGLLLLLGWGLYCIGPGEITFRFQNVLAQLSVTYFIAFLLLRKDFKIQLSVSLLLLVITELLYRLWPVAGFDQAFTPDKNFGAWLDMLISGELSGGHWVNFNAIPTAAHTIWGVMAGQVLMNSKTWQQKLRLLLIAAAVLLVVGYGLNPVTPIVKRISTTSFVLASGGWCLLTLGILYYLIDVRGYRQATWFAVIVGMNPLAIYLFTMVGGTEVLQAIIHPFVFGLFGWTGVGVAVSVELIGVWVLLWGICYWLYRNKIIIRI